MVPASPVTKRNAFAKRYSMDAHTSKGGVVSIDCPRSEQEGPAMIFEASQEINSAAFEAPLCLR